MLHVDPQPLNVLFFHICLYVYDSPTALFIFTVYYISTEVSEYLIHIMHIIEWYIVKGKVCAHMRNEWSKKKKQKMWETATEVLEFFL